MTEEDLALVNRIRRFRAATMKDMYVFMMADSNHASPSSASRAVNAARRLDKIIKEYGDE